MRCSRLTRHGKIVERRVGADRSSRLRWKGNSSRFFVVEPARGACFSAALRLNFLRSTRRAVARAPESLRGKGRRVGRRRTGGPPVRAVFPRENRDRVSSVDRRAAAGLSSRRTEIREPAASASPRQRRSANTGAGIRPSPAQNGAESVSAWRELYLRTWQYRPLRAYQRDVWRQCFRRCSTCSAPLSTAKFRVRRTPRFEANGRWLLPFCRSRFSKSYDIFETPGLTQVPAPARLASACKHRRGNSLSS